MKHFKNIDGILFNCLGCICREFDTRNKSRGSKVLDLNSKVQSPINITQHFLRTLRGAEFFVACIANLDKSTGKRYNYCEDSVCGLIYGGTPYYFQQNLQGDIIAVVNAGEEIHGKHRCGGIVIFII